MATTTAAAVSCRGCGISGGIHVAQSGRERSIRIMSKSTSHLKTVNIIRFEGLRAADSFSSAVEQRRRSGSNPCALGWESLGLAAALPKSGGGRGRRGVVEMGSKEVGVGIMATKAGMLQWFTSDGQAVPCTVIAFREGNVVTQVKTEETDGYRAVQVGYRRVREKKLTKPELGHLKKAGAVPMRYLQEFRVDKLEGYEPGQVLDWTEMFKEGDLVDITAKSIGKGFAGGIKRHNFARGPMSHGSKSHRQLGSIGAGTTPGRVYPGKKMPGRLGNARTKIRKLTILKIDKELNSMLIKGSVPGKAGNLLRITPAKIVGVNFK
eukprot:TRINITY_DN219_c0_g1_i2.p1 TRINITY_DN219_c0_g1~~TRINITY_DN219_c0_g1_i2.p1  ORF type:complete len:351 (+),score=61.64 TRINITY_DN219_c0_g1_i2:90-1055(+)